MPTSFIKAFGCSIFAAAFLICGACTEADNQDVALKNKQTVTPQQDLTEPTKDFLPQKSSAKTLKNKTLQPIADVYLNTNPKSAPQEGAFNCDDQVYLTIKFANHQPKLHQINISWKDPNGTERENNSFPFFVTEKESLAWASLKLHRSVGAGMLQWINPAAGMEEFIGIWSVEVQVGDLLNKTLTFEVLC